MLSDKQIVKVFTEELLLEHKRNDRKGIYAKMQKMMAYNSNKIEGSTLTSEQAASLFDTGSFLGIDGEVYHAKDIEEMNGHFAMFNQMLAGLDEPLSAEVMKTLHYYLKKGVFEDFANGYPVGEFKNRVNFVSDITTTSPSEVEERVNELLTWYSNVAHKDVSTLLRFHAVFEKIHPFQDGNGRVGRMILFRECLRNGLIPVIIKDETKLQYYAALHKAQVENDFSALYAYGEKQQLVYKEEMLPFIEHLLVEEKKELNVSQKPEWKDVHRDL